MSKDSNTRGAGTAVASPRRGSGVRFLRLVLPGLALVALLSLSTTAHAQVARPGPDSPWLLAPAFLPRGALINFAEGDPHKAMPIRVELALPDGYRMPAHYHAQEVHVEIRKGQLAVGTGDRLDPKRTRLLNPGDTITVPGQLHHFFIARGEETIVSLTAVGPLLFTYVEAEQDPSAKKPFGG